MRAVPVTAKIPPTEGSVSLAPMIDIGVARENRQLKESVAALEASLAEHRTRAENAPGITTDRLTAHSKGQCRYHLHVVVDEETPTVECADCHVELDAHAVLLQFATNERTFLWNSKDAQEKKDLEHEIDALKKIANNLRAVIRRRGGTAPNRDDLAWQRRAAERKKNGDL